MLVQLAEIVKGPLLQGHRRVDVKFKIKFEQLPEGIPHKWRLETDVLDRIHAAEAIARGKGHLARIGRKRPDRVDTGECEELHNIQLAAIRKGLTNNGFVLGEIFTNQDVDRITLILRFMPITGPGVELVQPPASITRAIRQLASQTWQNCFVWDNIQDDRSMTINVSGQQDEGFVPHYALVVKEGFISYVTVSESVSEEKESSESLPQ